MADPEVDASPTQPHEVDLAEGLALVVATAYRQAVALRDTQLAHGDPAVGASTIAAYLAEALEWAVKYQAWRDGQWAEPPESAEETLSRYLRGD